MARGHNLVYAYPQNKWTVGFLDLFTLLFPRLPLLVFGSRGLRLYKRGGCRVLSVSLLLLSSPL